MNILNKVVLITGASSGIGEACAYAFASKGYHVALAARNESELKRVQENCLKTGVDCICVKCDVAIEEECKRFIEQSKNHFGRIDILINNAGISMRAIFHQLDLAVIRQVMDINFWGSIYCTKYALPEILKHSGSVIGVSSVAGFKGLPGRTGYSASKFALEGFLEALRIENRKTGLHVGIICPGYTASNIRNRALNEQAKTQSENPLDESKLMPAEKVADYIVEMVLHRTRKKVLTTQGKLSFWLNKFFPSWVDSLVFKTISKEKDSPFR